jgi:hypothetical protein
MSIVNELKKQHPELGYSIIDFFDYFDISGSRKYLPLLCKLLRDKVTINNDEYKKDVHRELSELGIDVTKIPDSKIFLSHWFINTLNSDNIKIFSEFMKLMENNLIDKKDVTSYSSIDEIYHQISKAQMKNFEKSLYTQIHNEYEDDTWLVIRPLTFESSLKYGASTKWCTTSGNNPQHFVRYWKKGILVYFINKITGYKFAGYKELNSINPEFSFWDVQDNRVDSLQLGIEDYMYGIIKKIFSSSQTNENLSSDEQKEQVYKKEYLYLEGPEPDTETFLDDIAIRDEDDTYVLGRNEPNYLGDFVVLNESGNPMRVQMGGVHSVDEFDEPNESNVQINQETTTTSTTSIPHYKFFYH